MSRPQQIPRAAVLIIGDEVLRGKVVEKNAAFFVDRFRALGIRLVEVAFVEDDLGAIAEAVSRLASRAEVVCTSGGLGPTHDDVTIAGVAQAFDVAVVHSDALQERLTALMKSAPTTGHLRMTRVPAGAELIDGHGSVPWPTVRMRNVWVFPGVPWLLRAKFKDIEPHLPRGVSLFVGALHLTAEEAQICHGLDAVVAAHPAVDIGSYPAYDGHRWQLKLTVESADRHAAEAALVALTEAMSAFLTGTDPVSVLAATTSDGG